MFTVGEPGNQAIVHLPQEHVDIETVKQIEWMLKSPAVQHVRVMPDCHKGNGCCVGFTSHLTDVVVPGLIGGDIGCGVIMYPVSGLLDKRNACERINRVIRRDVPIGMGEGGVHDAPVLQREQYETFFKEAQEEAVAFYASYKVKCGVDIAEYMPTYSMDWFENDLCVRVSSHFEYDMRCMGTLGHGNHYIEIVEAEDGMPYIAVHTGSRNLGHNIAIYHQNKVTGPDVSGSVGLTGKDAALYLFDMIWAQTYARMNRRTILSLILYGLGRKLESADIIETVHNYIDFRDMVIRKGAIAAHVGQICVVSLNMRDGVLLCVGKGNEDWNWSGPHGCGRVLSRRKAIAVATGTAKDEAVAMRKFREEMGDVFTGGLVPELLDEQPSAYREVDVVRDAMRPTVDVVAHCKTVLNVKGI